MADSFSRNRISPLEGGFFSAMHRYGQIIFALLQREQERRRQSPLESMADILEPMLFVCIMGLVWTLVGASFPWIAGVCGVDVVARLLHSIMYVGEKQPGRTISFVLGQLAMLTMVVQIVRAIIGGAMG